MQWAVTVLPERSLSRFSSWMLDHSRKYLLPVIGQFGILIPGAVACLGLFFVLDRMYCMRQEHCR